MSRRLAFLLLAILPILALPGLAAAEGPRAEKPQSFIQGTENQNQNRNQPIHIEAATLEVRDKSKAATFTGDVVVVQGDTTLKCQKLVVFYGSEEGTTGKTTTVSASVSKPAPANPANAGAAAPAGPAPLIPQDAHDIRRIEAYTDVTVITKDQNATGEVGVYDLKSHTITLTGNVVVSQGKNVVRGDRVVVDTTTGISRVESATAAPSRVRALIMPNKANGNPTSNIMTVGPKN
jgi:lipopolysaccharide export system protein LptA